MAQGIEKSAKVFMPLLFLLLIILAVRAVTLDGAVNGLKFLFKPNMQHVKPTVFLDAMGQTFFSLSIGMGCLITYGSYFNNDVNITKTAVQVSTLDTLVAILAGVIIFPAAFALTSNPDGIVGDLVAVNFLDVASAKYMLPIGGLFISIFVGWILDKRLVAAQITNEGELKVSIKFLKVYIYLLRYIAPIAMTAIFNLWLGCLKNKNNIKAGFVY